MDSGNVKKAIYLGTGLFAAQFFWTLYNNFMPVFLQAGNSAFTNNSQALGFGLSATVAGFIMTLDNIAGFLLQPIMGPLSDKTRTRFGRRMPYILILAPISAIAFALIPIGPSMITPETNGNLSALMGPFILTMVSAVIMLLAMALWRTPMFALMPDIFPSALRSQANAIGNLLAGVGSIIALIAGGILFKMGEILPFALGSILCIGAVLILFFKIKEPAQSIEKADAEGGFAIFKDLREIPKDNRQSIVCLMLCIFFYLYGYNAIETFFSSYIATTFNLSAGTAGSILAIVALSFLVFAFPSAMLANKIGRKKTILIGLAIFSIAVIAIWFVKALVPVMCLLPVCGFAWAMININGLPMILDTSHDESKMGLFSGLYFIAATLGGIMGPVLNGFFIDLAGKNYSIIFLVCPVSFMLSFLALSGVRKGEIKAN
jgi:maltose/moltooligosaccharide transporter